METFALSLPADQWTLIADGAVHQHVEFASGSDCAIAIAASEPAAACNDWIGVIAYDRRPATYDIPIDRKVYGRALTPAFTAVIRGLRKAR